MCTHSPLRGCGAYFYRGVIMKALGLDIGTTTISAVVTEHKKVLSSLTLKNGSFLPAKHSWEKIQDPEYIRSTAMQAVHELTEQYPDVARIGVTGQMHGILYLNRQGEPVSPLYTWQDARGDQVWTEGESYTTHLSRLTGYPLAAGYGLVTHYYNLQNGLVPSDAVVFCTIPDYIAMLLAGATTPVVDAGNAASFGLFRVADGCFDLDALKKADIPLNMLPTVAAASCLGRYRNRIPVYTAIGDNQASFLGATDGDIHTMLVNVGTGSQFSVYTENYMTCPGLETRPFPGGYLLVGASLCGGRAYALLESFLRSVVQEIGGTASENCYEAMERLLAQGKPDELPQITPLFQGTRQDPTLRGSITGLSVENFTPRHLLWAMLEGMAAELHQLYLQYCEAGGSSVRLVGAGNGLRKNVHLQACFSDLFQQTLVMSSCTEEAAAGAAWFAAMQC